MTSMLISIHSLGFFLSIVLTVIYFLIEYGNVILKDSWLNPQNVTWWSIRGTKTGVILKAYTNLPKRF